ncbi:MAG: hypothetical protein IJL45_02880 [Prevotella sp.]|nr:hypothetical protein [Prevotella sp.]
MEYSNDYPQAERPAEARVEPKRHGGFWSSLFKILFGFIFGVALTEGLFILKLKDMEPKVTVIERGSGYTVDEKTGKIEKQDPAEAEESTLSDIAEDLIRDAIKKVGKKIAEGN